MKYINLFLIVALGISLGFNFTLASKRCVCKTNSPWVAEAELDLMKQEIDRLDDSRYEIIPHK